MADIDRHIYQQFGEALHMLQDVQKKFKDAFEDHEKRTCLEVKREQEWAIKETEYKTRIDLLEKKCEELEMDNSTLQVNYKQLLEEVQALKKVSHIIAVEKENARLRKELEAFKHDNVNNKSSLITLL